MKHNNIHDLSAFDFPVAMQDVFIWDPRPLYNEYKAADFHKAVVRIDKCNVLAIHSDNYKLTKHVDVFKSTLDVLDKVFGAADFSINDVTWNNGAFAMREIIVRDLTVIGPDGKPIQFRIRQVNSYDASSRYIMTAGTYREWCKNGAASLLGKISSTSQKHTSEIDIGAEQAKLEKAIEWFKRQPAIWKGWMRSLVSTEQVQELFQRTICKTDGLKYNKPRYNALMDAWERESLQLGRNKWAIYQAATWWSSHQATKKRTTEQLSVEFEPMVLAMVKSNEWEAL